MVAALGMLTEKVPWNGCRCPQKQAAKKMVRKCAILCSTHLAQQKVHTRSRNTAGCSEAKDGAGAAVVLPCACLCRDLLQNRSAASKQGTALQAYFHGTGQLASRHGCAAANR